MSKPIIIANDPRLLAEIELRRRRYESEMVKSAADIEYWCDKYARGYDPRLIDEGKSPIVPFVLYPFQRRCLHWMDEMLNGGDHGLIEKARDMGASYLTIIFDVHKWLFVPGYKAGWGSYKQDKVDERGNMDSMFEKARHLIDNLPAWMIPAGFSIGGDYDNHMRIINPVNGAAITGEVGKNIGRGGRNTRYTLDEHAFIEQADAVEKGVSQNANCVIYASTVNGMGTLFARKRFSLPERQIFIMDWREHPLKDQAWYEAQKAKLDEITLAQEVDRDYGAAVEGVMIDAKWVRAAIELDLPKEGPKVAGLDVGEKRDPSVYISRHGVFVTRIESWRIPNTTQTAFKAKGYAEEDGVEKLKYDDIGVGAGVTGTLNTEIADEDQAQQTFAEAIQQLHSGLELVGIPWGSTDVQGEPLWDNEERHLKERFLNQRAADWWHLRLRFLATYEHVEGIKEHPVEHLISIPNDHQLINELSMPLMQFSTTGKIKLESKKDMKKRGIPSPNEADALAYCFSLYNSPFIIGVW